MSDVQSDRNLDSAARFVIDVARGKFPPPDREITDEELRLAARHGLLGVLANSGHPGLENASRVPMTRLLARQQVMVKSLSRVLTSLAAAEIKATVVKGPALAEWVYGDPTLRTFTDIDVLLSPDQVPEALDVLRSDPGVRAIPPKTPRADKRDIPMIDPSGVAFSLDLHWDLFSYRQLRGAARGAIDDAWERASWVPHNRLGPMWRLPDDALTAFLATHSVLDHRFRLILFRDLAEVAKGGLDWDAYLEFIGRHGLRSLSYAAWSIATSVLEAKVPAEALEQMRIPSVALRAFDALLPKVDVVRFDGHEPHLLNLAIVLMHDRTSTRARLAMAAPFRLRRWQRRVGKKVGNVGRKPAMPARTPIYVLHLLPLDLARGAQTYARDMRDAMDGPMTVHRTATIFRSKAASLEADIQLGVKAGWGRRLGFSPVAAMAVARFVRRERPAVIVAHGGEALKYAALSRPRHVGLVYYKIGTSEPLLHNPVRLMIHRALVERADLVATVSREMATEARVLLHAPAHRVAFVPNGRDPADFTRAKVDARRTSTRFLFVGHLTASKRPDRFIDTITTLRSRGIDARGVVIGDGPLLDELTGSTVEGVEFVGQRQDVPELLAEGDVLLFTSDTQGEGMPGVLIEAGLAGLPVVSTDVPGARMIVEDGVTGFVIDPSDGRGFVEAAARLANDPSLRAKMGQAAHDRCMERFTLGASTAIWERNLANLLADVRR